MKNKHAFMFKYFILLLFFASLIACQNEPNKTEDIATAVQSKKDSLKNIIPQNSVVPFFSREGKFSVIFPDSPTVKSKVINSPEVGQIRLKQFFYEKEQTQAWLVSYSDYPAQMIRLGSNKRLLKGIRNQILQSLGSSAVNPQELKLEDQYEGISFEAYSSRQKMDVAYRIYLVNNRVYQLALFSSIGKFSPETINAFMDSFKLSVPSEQILDNHPS